MESVQRSNEFGDFGVCGKVGGATEVGSQWRQRPITLGGPASLIFQETTLAPVPKSMKLEFPKFKGENPLGWLYKAHQFFQLYNTPPNQKILLAPYHMEEKALIRFQEAEEVGQFASWEAFVRALHIRFGATAYNDPMDTLTRLRQVGSVALYKNQFEALSNRIKELSKKHN
nr:uncharacterized protein LOC111993148 [Quercus suber]